jgi:hypothetical protein
VIRLLAFRNFAQRPWRSALLLLGFGMGVSVMVVLLSVGEALITQARDRKLVGGGDVTVLPEGLDLEVMKVGGLGGMYFSIPNARFVQLQLLDAPRLAADVRAVAPQIEGKLVYLRLPDGREIPVQASADVPSASAAVGSAPRVVAGVWRDDGGDRRWSRPTPAELRHDIDHFHLPPAEARDRASWAEWHYFNVLSADRRRWAFVTLLVAGDVPQGRWGGGVLVTLREQDGATRRFGAAAPASAVRFSTTDADLTVGDSRVTVLPDGRYRVEARAVEEGRARGADDGRGVETTASGRASSMLLSGGGPRAHVDVDLIVTPAPRAYFPGAALSGGEVVSGYAVAALRADAMGTVCVDRRCERYDGAQAYHDHNWGTWQGVTWEWGAARAGAYTLLYGRVQPPDSLAAPTALFLYLVDSLGFRAVFRPARIDYVDGRTITVNGRAVRVPSRAVMADTRGDDTLRVELEIEDAIGTDTRASTLERGESIQGGPRRDLPRPYFIQMKGLARLSGRLGGAPLRGEGTGFFETYR